MREGKRIEQLMNHHRVFLQRGDTARPLFTIRRDRDSQPPPAWAESSGAGALVSPTQLDIESALDWCEKGLDEDAQVADDGFMPAAPWFSIPWMEAILGCPVRIYPTTLYAEPIIETAGDLHGVNFSLDSPWFEGLMELTQAMVERFAGQYPMCTAQLRGPLNMMASLLGSQRLCLEMYDHPSDVETLALKCADLWVDVTRAQLDIIPSYAEGYFNQLQIWTPGTTATGHVDFSSLMSRKMFQRLAIAAERHIVESLDFPIYHTHASSIHIIQDLASIDKVAAIQISLDNSVPREDILNTIRPVQNCKPVIVHRLHQADLPVFAESLSPRGLCLCLVTETLDQARQWIAWVRRQWPCQYG